MIEGEQEEREREDVDENANSKRSRRIPDDSNYSDTQNRSYRGNPVIYHQGEQDKSDTGSEYNSHEMAGEDGNENGVEDWKAKYIELKTQFDTSRKLLPTCEIYSDGKNINKGTKLQLELLVKNVMFPKQKFVDQSELGNLSDKNSIGNKLMDKLNIPESERIDTWKNYAYVVKKHLDKVRSNKTASMKNEFFKRGKILVLVCYFSINM